MELLKGLPVYLLLLLLLPLSVLSDAKQEIKVVSVSGGIKIQCGDGMTFKDTGANERIVEKKDERTGEYTCKSDTEEGAQIYVKFRSCDNCVELDEGSISGLAIGNVVATMVIGIAVYLVASHARFDTSAANRKSSDRQHLVPGDSHGRTPNEHYQGLKFKGGQREEYDVLQQNRR